MIAFPENLYCDLRIEDIFQTDILIENGETKQNRVRLYTGALIRVYDGDKWYYGVTTDIGGLQGEVDKLAALASPNAKIASDKVVRKFEVNQETLVKYENNSVRQVPRMDKLQLIQDYAGLFANFPEATMWKAYYKDVSEVRTFLSSKGANIKYDYQSAAASLRYNLMAGTKPGQGGKDIVKSDFALLQGFADDYSAEISRDIAYTRDAVPVKAGCYTCILAPVVTGVFAHESFGHKSEADFMIGDETMMKAWALGTRVGASELNILDRGDLEGNGYVPFDDEGTRARCNPIIKDGILTGRLHSAVTAAALDESLTGNARATSFEFEPIVRMTNTYIGSGSLTRDELFAGVDEGIFIEALNHGSGMSTFTIAPRRAYMIRGGQIAEPVSISVISGNVMETLHNIDGFSDQAESFSFALGGCGKMEQFPLRVGFGGPYIRVKGIFAQ